MLLTRHGRPFGKERTELGGDFRSDFVAAFPDAWAHRNSNIGGLGAEIAPHFFNRAGYDTSHGAAPAGMHRSNGTFSRIQ